MSLFSLILFSLGSLIDSTYKVVTGLNEHGLKNDLQFQLITSLNDEKAMKHNCEKNSDLKTCFDKGSPLCQAVADFKPLNVYNRVGERLAGTVADPVYLDKEGALCTGAPASCSFVITTAYRTQGHPEPLPGCKGDCRSYKPLEIAPANKLHELLIIKYVVARNPSYTGVFKASLADRQGSIIIGLDHKYNQFTGCPP